MPAAPRFVHATSFRPNKESKHRLSHDLTPCRDALQVSECDLDIMKRLDQLHLKHPFMGPRQLRDQLNLQDIS
ncbi:hypothetical protein JWZ98_17035 [Methylomonas sp. EFPC1]|uniref:hypothetical protein n=1 Tax=Methylomonas sp. EFPC1 TaxID=2812647 RepID=UPI0019673AE6|nr:hypothetical protein [Methylomonas sp. EFPC1]QSB00371.1 hypothetical protein JWZ98_17035 [Methylomonas sp. EFPC1]